MAAWTDQRQLVANLRQPPVPRDLGPRIRAGIESGAFAVPWWRRNGLLVGVGASLATVAAAVLAVVVISDLLPGPPVASSGSPSATALISLSPAPTATEPAESPAPSPSPPGIAPEAIPPYYLALAGPLESPKLTLRDGDQGTLERELPTPPGQPIRAALSPDGHWLAYITPVGLKGTNMYWVVDLEDGSQVELGESSAIGSPFTNALFWSPDSRYLTFTLTDELRGRDDAWVFNATNQSVRQLTQLGNVVAAGWRTQLVDSHVQDPRAWVSVASANPISYELPDLAGASLPINPAQATTTSPGVFQPLWNRDGRRPSSGAER